MYIILMIISAILVQVLKDVKKVKKAFGFIFGGAIAFIVLMVIISMAAGCGNSKDVYIVKRVANVESEQAEKIDNIGIKDIDDMKADREGLDGFEGKESKGYRIKTNFSDNVIL